MIRVESLSKSFADAEAVREISFHVEKGEILGFLGPNGAGKTTTMRMLTCYVPPTAGTAVVAGYDIFEQPLEVRRRVGYLPESVPLYGEMRVDEYLRYRARLKGVPRSAVDGRLDYVSERCGLTDVRRKIIDHLSKGFRQRVGLAESLLSNPPILILDEPTVGLDPNQIRQVRELIRDLGREHTIILSSHILPEVEQVCGRVVIISRGVIVAEDEPEALRREMEGTARLEVEIAGPGGEILAALESLRGVTAVRGHGERPPADGTVGAVLEHDSGQDLREEVFRLAVARGWVLLGLTRRSLSLEDVFVDLTTREPAEAASSGAGHPDGARSGGDSAGGDSAGGAEAGATAGAEGRS